MRATEFIGLLASLLISLIPACARAQGVVTEPAARLGASWVGCEGMAQAVDLCARDLLRRVRTEAELDYVAKQNLHATPAEIEDVRAYDRAFRTHDRAQRSRKLAELDERLAAMDLPADVRTRLDEFRAILDRLAQYEADVDAGIEPRVEPSTAQIAHWIEQSKLEAALYRRYGGVIGVNAAGPYAHGARAALVLDYLDVRALSFMDRAVEAEFMRLLSAPPAIVFRGEHPNFIPFWQRAIPASYMPD